MSEYTLVRMVVICFMSPILEKVGAQWRNEEAAMARTKSGTVGLELMIAVIACRKYVDRMASRGPSRVLSSFGSGMESRWR